MWGVGDRNRFELDKRGKDGMNDIINLEAILCARQPGYIAALEAVQACDALKGHLMGDAPMNAAEVASALDTIQRATEAA